LSRPLSPGQKGRLKMATREIVLIAMFSSIWIASEISLGPVIGRFSVGPFSLHGAVNRVMGWLLMLVLAELTGRFGRASLMAFISALGTRLIRVSLLEGTIVGAGYALGGLAFDSLFFLPPSRRLKGRTRKTYILSASLISAVVASAPYLLWKLWVLGVYGFIAMAPIYASSTLKGIVLSVFGTSLGLSIAPTLRDVWLGTSRGLSS